MLGANQAKHINLNEKKSSAKFKTASEVI